MSQSVNINLSEPQHDFLYSESEYTLYCGGVGSGKTFIGALWAIMMSQKYPNARGLITANTHSQLTKATLAELFKICDMMGIKYKFNVNHQRLFIGDTEVLCYTMEKPENLAGPTVGWWWGDEVAFYRQLAFDKGSARVRDKRGPCHIKFTTTPNGFNWLYEFFVEKDAKNKSPKKVSKRVITGSTLDNARNLPSSYVQRLTEQYDKKMAAQELNGQFVNISDGQVYYNFDRNLHTGNYSLLDTDYFLMGLDFNVHPLCGVFVARRGEMIYIVDELYLENSNTFAAAKAILEKYPYRRPLIIADETGNRRKSSSAKTDHEILRRAGFEVAPFKNPPVKDRQNNINRLFERNYIKIDKRCVNLIKDLEQVTYETKNDLLTHISDALGYVCWHLNPLRKPRRSAGNL